MTDLVRAEVSLRCSDCGRGIRTTLQEVREGRTIRCVAGHRMELGFTSDWPIWRPRRPPPFDQDAQTA